LRIGVDQQNTQIVGCQRSSQVNRGRGLPDAALLIRNRYYFSQRFHVERGSVCFTWNISRKRRDFGLPKVTEVAPPTQCENCSV